MIKVYSAKITDLSQADYTKMYSLLDCALRGKIDEKKCEKNRLCSLAGYILLYRGAYEIYGKRQFSITFNEYGKPLCDFCFFSISHSFDNVVCVFSDKNIGADIQKIPHIKPRKKYKFFNQKENFYVNRCDDLISKRYVEIFTKKEAAVKMLGVSLAEAASVDTFSDEFCFETTEIDGCIFTVCVKRIVE